jgi:hypothetical protein
MYPDVISGEQVFNRGYYQIKLKNIYFYPPSDRATSRPSSVMSCVIRV